VFCYSQRVTDQGSVANTIVVPLPAFSFGQAARNERSCGLLRPLPDGQCSDLGTFC